MNKAQKTFSHDSISVILTQIELLQDTIDKSMSEEDQLAMFFDELNSFNTLDPYLNCWEASSKMRIWLQEKRRDISNTVQNLIDDKQLTTSPKKSIDFTEVADEKTKIEEVKQGEQKDDEEETINTESGKSKKIPKSVTLNEDVDNNASSNAEAPQQYTKEHIMDSEKERVLEIIKKVCDKAELLVKLESSPSWNNSDSFQKDSEDPSPTSKMLSTNMKKAKSALRFKSISEKQSSKEKDSYEKVSSKEVFENRSTSVLAILQCPLTANDIIETLESKYVASIRRYMGLRMIHSLFTHFTPQKNDYVKSLIWFKKSLKQNLQELCHYSDGILAGGEYMIKK